MTKPVWDAEDKARRRTWWEEGLTGALTNAEIWAKAEADRMKQQKESAKAIERIARLARTA